MTRATRSRAERPPFAPSSRELARLEGRQLMPNLVGRSITEVRRLAAASSFDLHVRGTGRAIEQAPAAGTILEGKKPFVIVRFQPSGKS
jgi:hypothetical protein